MRLEDAVVALSASPAKRRTQPRAEPAQAEPTKPSQPRQTIPLEVMAKWHADVAERQRRAATNPYKIVIIDDNC